MFLKKEKYYQNALLRINRIVSKQCSEVILEQSFDILLINVFNGILNFCVQQISTCLEISDKNLIKV